MARNKKPVIDLQDDYFGTVLNCAVRYCLGRMTYMPKLVCDYIRPLLPYLSDKTLWCFDKDCDEEMWMKFWEDVKVERERRKADE